MQLSISVSDFYRSLEIVEKALPTRSTISFLNNIYLELSGTQLSFYATNLEMEIKTALTLAPDHEKMDSFAILLPQKIIEVLRYFPTNDAFLVFDPQSYRITVSGGSAEFSLFGADPHDYPERKIDSDGEDLKFQIKQAELKKYLKMVLFSASTDETRPAFNGILFEFKGNKITLTASDTYRLAVKEIIKEEWNFKEAKCLVPARSLREFLKILGDDEQMITVVPGGNKISFDTGLVYLSARLLQEKFPDVSSIIPQAFQSRIKIDKKLLEDTISRAALLAEGKNQAVQLAFQDNALIARVTSQQGKMEEKLSAQIDGENLELFVNTKFVLDLLKVTEDLSMSIDLHGHEGPLIFMPSGEKGYLYLVLPIKKVN